MRFGNSSKKFRATADGRLFVELHRSAGGSDDSQTAGELSPVAWRRVLVCTANSWTVCLSGLLGGAADGEVFALQIICMRSELGPLSQGGVGGSSLPCFELENLCKKKKKEISEKTCKETLREERILPWGRYFTARSCTTRNDVSSVFQRSGGRTRPRSSAVDLLRDTDCILT